MEQTTQKKSNTSKLLIVVLALLLVAAIGWRIHDHKAKSVSAGNTVTQTTPQSTYTSKLGGFTISYPQSWSIEGFIGQNNVKVTGAQLTGNEYAVLLRSTSSKVNSFGLWLVVSGSRTTTSSANSDFTEIPYYQGTIIKTLQNGLSIWQANQTFTSNGHTITDGCVPLETVSNGLFGAPLHNGYYLDASMSFCYAQSQTTTEVYNQQITSPELQTAMTILGSLKQQ